MKLNKINSTNEWSNWDDFIKEMPETSFLSYSFWLDTYLRIPWVIKKIGFTQRNQNVIIAGIAGIKIGFGRFSRIVFPSGPYGVNNQSTKDFFQKLIEEPELKKAKLVQFASVVNLTEEETPLKIGKRFKKIYLDPGFGNIPLEKDQAKQLAAIKYKVSRYIKASLGKNLELEMVTDTQKLPAVYALFEQNAKDANYRIRPFRDYKKAWNTSLKNGQSVFMLVKHDGAYKGAAWLMDCGKKLHYIMGGTSKKKPRLEAGYFLHWQAILESIKRGYDCYNISVGGSESVEKFKDDFGRIKTNNIHYYYFENGKSKK